MNNKKILCNMNCCVFGCRARKGRERELSFHRFPKEKTSYVYMTNELGIKEKVDRKKAWELILLMGKSASSTLRVCSLHFKENDYILPGYKSKLPRLRSDAVPSQNLAPRQYTKAKKRAPKKEDCSSDAAVAKKLNLTPLEETAVAGLLALVKREAITTENTN